MAAFDKGLDGVRFGRLARRRVGLEIASRGDRGWKIRGGPLRPRPLLLLRRGKDLLLQVKVVLVSFNGFPACRRCVRKSYLYSQHAWGSFGLTRAIQHLSTHCFDLLRKYQDPLISKAQKINIFGYKLRY